MSLPKLKYQSFCWVIGTTSFRTAKLNLKIEQQLLLLNKLYIKIKDTGQEWNWDKSLQVKFYDLMLSDGFLVGNAKLKDKDARQKTSGLVDIGLVTSDRLLTESGKTLLQLTQNNDFVKDNEFYLDKDSYLYFKQLLKTSLSVGESNIRPYFILAYLLNELNYLSYDEFRYFLPLCISTESTLNIICSINKYRDKQIDLVDIIYKNIKGLKNYQRAYNIFLDNEVSEQLICEIGINRKSANYDKPYYWLYVELKNYFLDNTGSIPNIFNAIKNINQKTKWLDLIFNSSNLFAIKKLNREAIRDACPFLNCETENDLKRVFFKYLHTFKAMATLEDYFDLNRRYFSLTDTLVFSDQKVSFDLIPSYFFKTCSQAIFYSAFTSCDNLGKDIDLFNIHSSLIFDSDSIYKSINQDHNVLLKNSEQAKKLIADLRISRFNHLINEKFDKNKLLQILMCFKERKDDEIMQLVTEEADIPTIFEYILAIIWYEISERQGNILDYMKLSLSANLLPKTHAGGGYADIIYEYDKTEYYPKHSLLIEATLAESTNQRRMEMEPVSRHLGEYRLKYNNPFDYSLFVTTFLNMNVISDFRARKNMRYYGRNNEYVESLKIIPMDIERLSGLLKNEVKYRDLYKFFEEQYHSQLRPDEWYNNMVKEQPSIYQVKTR